MHFRPDSCCDVGSHVIGIGHDTLDKECDCLQTVVVPSSIFGFECCGALLGEAVLIRKSHTITGYMYIAQLARQAELLEDGQAIHAALLLECAKAHSTCCRPLVRVSKPKQDPKQTEG